MRLQRILLLLWPYLFTAASTATELTVVVGNLISLVQLFRMPSMSVRRLFGLTALNASFPADQIASWGGTVTDGGLNRNVTLSCAIPCEGRYINGPSNI